METIHLKTVDPISQDLLRVASQQGHVLVWERYERLQPQDGFLRLGLSCPYGCLQGPCRIDPFGNGPHSGVCGLERDGMVAAMLLRLALQGALEAMNDASVPGISTTVDLPPLLEKKAIHALQHVGGTGISIHDLFRGASLLSRPGESPEILIQQALRLGLMSLGLMEQPDIPPPASTTLPLTVGYGILARGQACIAVAGRPSGSLLEAVKEEVSRNSKKHVLLVSLGEWISLNNSFLPFASSAGDAELVLTSGAVHCVIAGPGADPSLRELCKRCKVPLIGPHESVKAKDIVNIALRTAATRSGVASSLDPSLVKEARVVISCSPLENMWKNNRLSGLVLVGGADMPQQSLGWIPTELASGIQAQGWHIASWGDAALWMLKRDGLEDKGALSLHVLEPCRGTVLALKALAASGQLEQLKGVCITGLRACRELAAALGMACLGSRVCVAVPLPLWGSLKTRELLADTVARCGGEFMHFDHMANPQEILEWLAVSK